MNINKLTLPVLSKLKKRFVKSGRKPRRVLSGIYKGLKFNLDLQFEMQIYLGLWERETYKHIKRIASNTNWLIDIGSGKGELCIYFLGKHNVSCAYAIDPDFAESKLLQNNLELNDLLNNKKITIINRFAGSKNDNRFMRIDDLENNLSGNGFIKIDVEGAELDVLRGGESVLLHKKTNILLETHSMENEKACIEWLESRNYKTKIIKNAWWRMFVPEYRTISHNRWLWADNSRI